MRRGLVVGSYYSIKEEVGSVLAIEKEVVAAACEN